MCLNWISCVINIVHCIYFKIKNVFIYYPYYNKPGIWSFKKDGSRGMIRTDNLSIISLELCRCDTYSKSDKVLNICHIVKNKNSAQAAIL